MYIVFKGLYIMGILFLVCTIFVNVFVINLFVFLEFIFSVILVGLFK